MAKKKHRLPQVVLGVDVGGTGIKGALVDTKAGALVGDRYRIPTPQPATPEAVAATVAEIAEHFKWSGRMGCTMPALVRRGTVESAINIDPSWVGTDAAALFAEATGHPAYVLNDGDAAGLAEVRFGAGAGQEGTVLVLTLGTGVGSALFVDGRLVPNTEFGHLQLDGLPWSTAPRTPSASARTSPGRPGRSASRKCSTTWTSSSPRTSS
jgi:polyphosphate glucokinase